MADDLNNAAAPPDTGAGNEPGEIPPPAPAASDPANEPGAPLHSEADGPREGAPPRENAIPHHRVKEMVGRAEARVRSEYEARVAELEKRIAAFGGSPAAGPSPEAPGPASEPAPPSGERINWRRLFGREDGPTREAEAEMRRQYAHEAQIAIRQNAFHNGWASIEREHRAILSMPGAPAALREAALEAWRAGGDPLAAAREAARGFYFQAAQLQRARDEARRGAARIVRAGGGAGAPGEKPRGSIAERISSRLAGRSGGGGF